ncbi:MAG: carboxypeptidase-like regulatory domain-containing protein [Chitinophagaceae bacterium]|nr:carboxypeptidase-like regulatory domain-containing protein [Chitinophagaceae bacterium]
MLRILIILLLSSSPLLIQAQSLLGKPVSVHAKSQPLKDVLTIISNEGNFYFSYNSKVVKPDSLVTVNVSQKPVQEVLRMIFTSGYEFKESGNYIIIRRKPISTSSVVAKSPNATDYYFINGFIVDEETGEKIPNATIYEKQNLISSLSDEKGYFSLRLKNKYKTASISVSKVDYIDTTVEVVSNYNQKVTIALVPKPAPIISLEESDTLDGPQVGVLTEHQEASLNEEVEKNWLSKMFITSKQKIQSLNLQKFYTTRAWQFSLVPGIGTHGKMNPQVVNGVSINLIGGYAGGTSLIEIGGLFNIDRKDVKSCQIGGLFNLVGGQMDGVQISSLYNETKDTVKGTQISGLVNLARKHVKGLQIATLVNKAKSIEGVQIGFINITDSQQGTSIGLINISRGKKRHIGFLVRWPRKQRPA